MIPDPSENLIAAPVANRIVFVVYGAAQTKGSTRAFVPKGWTRPVITNTNRNAKAWEALVAEAANRALTGAGVLLHGPIRLHVDFYLPRPKSLPRTKDVPHIKAPDCTKLIRCTEDALSGVVFRDDSQVVDVRARKYYAGLGESPRAVVTIEPLSAAERL